MTNSPMPEYLPATPDDSPCDGSHGRFCPECAAINRWCEATPTQPIPDKKD